MYGWMDGWMDGCMHTCMFGNKSCDVQHVSALPKYDPRREGKKKYSCGGFMSIDLLQKREKAESAFAQRWVQSQCHHALF
jgi:hypothetical protein